MPSLATSLRHLYVQCEMPSPQTLLFDDCQIAAFSRGCPDHPGVNDDSMAVVRTPCGATVLVVADGVGGGPAGHKASAIATESVAEAVESSEWRSNLRSVLLDAMELANRRILELGIGAATTLSAVEIREAHARAYQVGDCMSLIIGQRGVLKWRSTPHSPVGYAVASGMLSENEGLFHEDRHVVSNVLGTREMHLDVGPRLPLSPRDTVLVASDGLFDNLFLDEVIELARRGPIEQRVDSLVTLASDRMDKPMRGKPGKADDLSLLLFTMPGV